MTRPAMTYPRQVLCLISLLSMSSLASGQESVEEIFSNPSGFEQQSKMINLVGNSDMDALDGLIGEALQLEKPGNQAKALELIFTRYSELDPERSFYAGLKAKLPDEGRWMYGLAYWWAQKDLDAALAAAAKVEGETQGWVVRGIYESQADQDEEFLAELVARIKAILPPPSPPEERPPEPEGPDLDALWAEAVAERDAQAQRQKLHSVVSMWSRTDPIAALEHIDQLPNYSDRQNLRSLLYSIAGRMFPEEMIGLLDQIDSATEQDNLIQSAFFVLAQRDGEHAWQVARSLPTVELQEKAINTTLSGWSGSDPRAAAQAFAELPDRTRYDQAGGIAVGAYTRLAPDEALSWAESLDGPGGYLWNMVLRSLAFNQPERALEIINDISDPIDQQQALESVLKSIEARQPKLAIEYGEMLPDGEMKTKIISNAARHWSNQDVLAVLDWVTGQPAEIQVNVMRGLAEPLARKDLKFAMSYPLDLVPAGIQRDWVASILIYAARENPVQAHAWINGYQEQPNYPYWLMRLGNTWAQSDPYAALNAVRELQDEQERSRAMSNLIGGWASSDGASAAGYVDSLPSAADRLPLIHSVAYNWHRAHASAARKWVMDLQTTEERDRGLAALVNAVAPDIVLAEEYIRLMESDDGRYRAYSTLIGHLVRTDIPGAQRYLDSLAVPAATRPYLQEIIDSEIQVRERAAGRR